MADIHVTPHPVYKYIYTYNLSIYTVRLWRVWILIFPFFFLSCCCSFLYYDGIFRYLHTRPPQKKRKKKKKRRDPIEIQLLEECFLFSWGLPFGWGCVSNPTKSFPSSYKHMQGMLFRLLPRSNRNNSGDRAMAEKEKHLGRLKWKLLIFWLNSTETRPRNQTIVRSKSSLCRGEKKESRLTLNRWRITEIIKK